MRLANYVIATIDNNLLNLQRIVYCRSTQLFNH